MLSTLVKSHRGKFSLSRFNKLPEPWRPQAPLLAILLRLAVLLHRNRNDIDLPEFKISITKSKIQLQFPKNWLNQAPLTYADLQKEADLLKPAGFKLEFA